MYGVIKSKMTPTRVFFTKGAWDKRKRIYDAISHIFRTKHICQSVKDNKDGLWTTVIAAAVFIIT